MTEKMERSSVQNHINVNNSLRKIPEHVSIVVEHFFYRIGFSIAKQPKKWILFCLLPVVVCLAGFTRFRQEKNPLNLWVPPDSDFVRDTEWLMSSFGEGQRVQQIILTAYNVLDPQVLLKLNNITQQLMTVRSNKKFQVSWKDVCFQVPVITNPELISRKKRQPSDFDDDFFDKEPTAKMNSTYFEPVVHAPIDLYCKVFNSLPKGCLVLSILDLWHYNSTIIEQLTIEDVIEQVNSIKISPVIGHYINYTEFLGGAEKDEKGRIVSARAIKTQFMVRVNFSQVNMDKIGNDAGTADWATEDVLEWELLFLNELKEYSQYLETENKEISLQYEAGRSFGDISSSILFQDIDKLIIGIFLMAIYVQIILSNFNCVEWRFFLTMFALFCIGSAFIVAVGACSLIGIPYGPVHTSLPFLLMGLGVDDTFIMMASWEQILSVEKNRMKPLAEQVGLMLSHAGAAICITSLTDVVAFIIGASTILPSLQSYCIYAAVGVFVTFLFQITLFVAIFTLDAQRIHEKRNCLIPCIVYEDFSETHIMKKRSTFWKILDTVYNKAVLTTPAKILIILITIVITGFGAYGSYYLEQWFDPVWFLPEDSYLSNYLLANKREFPQRGHAASVFISGNVNYIYEFEKILKLSEALEEMKVVENVESWPRKFVEFLKMNYEKDILDSSLSENNFHQYLSTFLFSHSGGKYQKNFRFDGNLICGKNVPRIKVFSIDFTFARLSTPHEWIPAMDNTKKTAADAGIDGYVFVWSKMFGMWVTDKVIAQEVMRNLILALVCVMTTTAFLIAELQTCFWILLCVLLTLLDVCGFMYFWGFTIDIASCISLELAVGLSVDYAAHIAHAFLNTPSREGKNKDRQHRTLIAVRHIGAAVMYGAGSTLLALSLMALSKAYVFQIFFKIFFMVISFGLWHGLMLLPVILSTVGPRHLKTHEEPPARELESLSANVCNSDQANGVNRE